MFHHRALSALRSLCGPLHDRHVIWRTEPKGVLKSATEAAQTKVLPRTTAGSTACPAGGGAPACAYASANPCCTASSLHDGGGLLHIGIAGACSWYNPIAVGDVGGGFFIGTCSHKPGATNGGACRCVAAGAAFVINPSGRAGGGFVIGTWSIGHSRRSGEGEIAS